LPDVTVAKDGQEAFNLVRDSMSPSSSSGKIDPFNLIFMDVQMPNLDGIQSTKLIREMGFTAPIVALTAFAEKSNEEECMASGMDHFLPKPIRRPALKQVLKKYCATIPEEEGEGSMLRIPTKSMIVSHATPTESSRNTSSTGSPVPKAVDAKKMVNGHSNGTITPTEHPVRKIPNDGDISLLS
jgi:osomolarity two-component system sensor histidine kinase SLN1